MKTIRTALATTLMVASSASFANSVKSDIYVGAEQLKSQKSFEYIKVTTDEKTDDVLFFQCNGTAQENKEKKQLVINEEVGSCQEVAYSNKKALNVHRENVFALSFVNALNLAAISGIASQGLGTLGYAGYVAVFNGASTFGGGAALWTASTVLFYGAPVVGTGAAATTLATNKGLKSVVENITTQISMMDNILKEKAQQQTIVTNDYERLKTNIEVVMAHAARSSVGQ